MRTHRAAAGWPSRRAATSRAARVLTTGLLTLVPLFAVGLAAGQKAPWPNVGEDPLVTPVTGPSWLTELGLKVDRTRLGQGGGQYGPPADQSVAAGKEPLGVPRFTVVRGQDLYRFNCQACHRAEGTGAPPEIRSVLEPVQGSSLELVRTQLQGTGTSDAAARAKVKQAHADLLARIRNGGQRMPARSHLQDADIRALFAYLTELAGTPHPEKQSERAITWARVGEHVVKGTCHICHDAIGPPPSTAAVASGTIPSLQALMATKRVAEIVRKARSGALVPAGEVAMFHRGRMPVFHYLRPEEIAAAYMYLATYPPQDSARR